MHKVDLLTSLDKQSYFINCRVNGEVLEVGAVFIASFSSSPMKLISEESASFTIEIPDTALNKDFQMVSADTSFYIVS